MNDRPTEAELKGARRAMKKLAEAQKELINRREVKFAARATSPEPGLMNKKKTKPTEAELKEAEQLAWFAKKETLTFATEKIALALRAARQEGYRQGNIDHQLVLEASTEKVAEQIKGRIDGEAGEPMIWSFDAEEIKEKLRREGRVEGAERVFKVVKKEWKKDVWQDAKLLDAARSALDEIKGK